MALNPIEPTPETDLISDVPALFLSLTETEKLRPMSITGSYYGPKETYEVRTAIAALPGLINAAAKAQDAANERALSYRDYRVGAAAIMANFATRTMAYMDGYNVKPAPGKGGINLHAEQIAIAKGRANGLSRVIGITVAADPLDLDANPNKLPTLPPCRRCVEMFVSTPEIDERTLILGVTRDYSQAQLYTLNSLLDSDIPHLVPEPFPLVTDDDLTNYDRNIVPYLIKPIYEMYGASL